MNSMICLKSLMNCQTPGMCSPHGGCQPVRSTRQEGYDDGYRAGVESLQEEIAALRKDKDRLDTLEGNCWDVRFASSPNGDAGDHSTGIKIVGRWMDKPHERVVGENYNENLRAAIDQAMTADSYPPARPEYDDADLNCEEADQ